MWSGPRNLSTAMMYSFAARGDCAVWDEPFYAAYLQASGAAHPMREESIATGETDPALVAEACLGPTPDGRPVFYQKHMTHHMLPEFNRSFMRDCVNVFLIRHPARVVASYAKKREGPKLEDIGFVQQVELFDEVSEWLGKPPLVIDSADIRADPAGALNRLCAAIGVPFTEKMLRWPAGGHPADGAWAKHWYGAVHRSTGFAGPEGPLPKLEGEYAALAKTATPHFERLTRFKL